MIEISVSGLSKEFEVGNKILDGLTFQVDSGDRMELSVTGQEFGLIAEGDTGKLTFQGTRFLGFERNR